MPLLMQVGQTGTLQFLPTVAGLDASVVTSTAWQPQGGQTAIKFTQPDRVEAIAPGLGKYKCTVTMAPGEKAVYDFDIEAQPAGPPAAPKAIPVAVNLTMTPPA